jgi:hypothetical protein
LNQTSQSSLKTKNISQIILVPDIFATTNISRISDFNQQFLSGKILHKSEFHTPGPEAIVVSCEDDSSGIIAASLFLSEAKNIQQRSFQSNVVVLAENIPHRKTLR